MLKTIAQFHPDEVFVHVPKQYLKKVPKVEFIVGKKSYFVKTNSLRLKVFKANRICVCCGIVGEIFLLQNHLNECPHFNFYALKSGEYILLTQDHIIPQSLGGENTFCNLQTMCSVCNMIKADSLISNDSLKKIYNEYIKLISSGISSKKIFPIIEKLKTSLEYK
jgi:5-methylcytosine-specific restriction endonuclease McrA